MVLKKGVKQRSEAEKKKIVPLLKKIEFFQTWDLSDENYLNLINALHFERAFQGSILFEIGQQGDKFYLILHGKVGVYVPFNKNKDLLKKPNVSQIDKMNIWKSMRASKMFEKTLSIDVLKKLENLNEFIELKNGQSFGEGALLNDKPRGASILCKTDCYFAVMNKLDFNQQLHWMEAKTKIELLEFLG